MVAVTKSGGMRDRERGVGLAKRENMTFILGMMKLPVSVVLQYLFLL